MRITQSIKDLMERLENEQLSKDEIVKILKRIDKVPEFKSNAAFFGYDIRLGRLQKSESSEDTRASQEFLNSAFRIYFKEK
ncbi:MAG: hypothetical protein H7096_04975 [Flavobacterium sp.]|nr:hypothetical protein [Pedobacter sp.]